MDQNSYSRRNFIKGVACAGGTTLMMGTSLGLLSGCSDSVTSRQSYIRDAISPGNRSPIFVWTDIMLQAVRNQSITPPRHAMV